VVRKKTMKPAPAPNSNGQVDTTEMQLTTMSKLPICESKSDLEVTQNSLSVNDPKQKGSRRNAQSNLSTETQPGDNAKITTSTK
jgi:hypothetical protein